MIYDTDDDNLPVLSINTLAAPTTAPVSSVTIPFTLPVNDCPNRLDVSHSASMASQATLLVLMIRDLPDGVK
jgi:hypothetical protein